jgi:hypothetical protein
VAGNWKERISQEPHLTPLELLASHYQNDVLPEPKKLSNEEIEHVTAEIREKIRFLAERQVFMLTGLKQSLEELPAADRQNMETYLGYMLNNFEEMITILPEKEQAEYEDFIKTMRSD